MRCLVSLPRVAAGLLLAVLFDGKSSVGGILDRQRCSWSEPTICRGSMTGLQPNPYGGKRSNNSFKGGNSQRPYTRACSQIPAHCESSTTLFPSQIAVLFGVMLISVKAQDPGTRLRILTIPRMIRWTTTRVGALCRYGRNHGCTRRQFDRKPERYRGDTMS